jgi:hypothetical protein
MRALGIILVVLGILGFVYQGFSYTKREKVVDIGSIEASVDKKERVFIPPVASAIAIGAGALILLAGRRSTA